MAFAQITGRRSLRDLVICLRAQRSKLYHMGIRGGVARSTRKVCFTVWHWCVMRMSSRDTDSGAAKPKRVLTSNEPLPRFE